MFENSAIWGDIRYAVRIMSRTPLFTATVVATVAIAIAANATIFTVVNAVMIRALPFAEPNRIMQVADNAGATDEHRALNYCALRYPAIYARAAESYGNSCSLSAVEVRPSRLSGVRKVVDVIFSYTNRSTDVSEKFFVRVDVTEEFPFLVTKMSPYYDR